MVAQLQVPPWLDVFFYPDRKYEENLHTELMGVAGLLRTPFVGVPFGLIGEATIPLDIARIQPLFGFESRLLKGWSNTNFVTFL